ncbi:hypothetical protein HELRODRAFT_64903, partial [Helobdella robusta]|uniref:beta-mannosidase n=1 Tax=Helobdella robusta TaxID=6412 RepID=T1FY09_HELRO
AKVPGEVHLALFEHGLIEDPLYRYNDVENKWVAWSNWTYSKQFNVSNEDLKSQQVDLVLEGFDTVAEVFLNGQRIGTTRNMFRRYVFNVKHLLRSSTCNLLAIKFVSPVWYARQEAINYPYRVPPECPPDVQHGECSYNFIRKAAYSFSWDWGPSYPSLGVWLNLYLNMFDYASLEYVTCETVVDNNNWRLQISTFLLVSGQSFGKSLKVIVSISQLNVTYEEIVVLRAIHQKHDNSSSIKMWWPYGMGDQVLYAVVSHFELDSKMIRIGFRTVDLVQDYVQEDNGLTFYFSINNQPLFLKGSNWIPMTNFLTNQTSDEADWLLRSAIEVNMNVLRVWGGGVYETDEFYQRADELGILIWQDFMFACALYPTNRMFLDDVRLETIHQVVRRLKHHPSIIIWSGNNENEGVLANNWYGISDEDFPMYKSDYVKLYVDVIRDVILHEDMSRPYISSSPTNGLQTMKEGWVSKNPQDVRFGDIHFYNYTMDGWQPAFYLKPRMASEFGFQSWSSAESLLDVSRPKDDWKLMGEFALHRQHHSNGEKEIFYEINQHMEFNLTSKNDTEHFIHYVYLSQINQAMSVRAQVEHYRRSACLGLCGDGGTMGALYWQLNDVWQAPTWSSIEHNGKWKLLHYYARHFFSSYLISPVISEEVLNENGKKDDVIQFYSIIDHMYLDEVLHNSSNLTLTVSCYQIELFYVAKIWTFPYDQVFIRNFLSFFLC